MLVLLCAGGIAVAYSLAAERAPAMPSSAPSDTAAVPPQSSHDESSARLVTHSPAPNAAAIKPVPVIGDDASGRNAEATGPQSDGARSDARTAHGNAASPLAGHADPDSNPLMAVSSAGGRNLEPVSPPQEEILHITNIGDRIIVSRQPEGSHPESAADRRENPRSTGTTAVPGQQYADENAGPTEESAARPDYEDVYPGCPRILPQGADAQMALERQQNYGCLYYESCEISEESPPPCRWYLVKKL